MAEGDERGHLRTHLPRASSAGIHAGGRRLDERRYHCRRRFRVGLFPPRGEAGDEHDASRVGDRLAHSPVRRVAFVHDLKLEREPDSSVLGPRRRRERRQLQGGDRVRDRRGRLPLCVRRRDGDEQRLPCGRDRAGWPCRPYASGRELHDDRSRRRHAHLQQAVQRLRHEHEQGGAPCRAGDGVLGDLRLRDAHERECVRHTELRQLGLFTGRSCAARVDVRGLERRHDVDAARHSPFREELGDRRVPLLLVHEHSQLLEVPHLVHGEQRQRVHAGRAARVLSRRRWRGWRSR